MIKFGFPGEHPDYHSYEALQIFNDAGAFPELLPNREYEFLEDDSGVYPVPANLPDKERARFIYVKMSELTGYSSPWGCLTGVRPAKIANMYMSEGKTPEETKKFLMDFFCVSEDKADLTIETALNQKDALESQKNNPSNIGVYLGTPFCPTRCLYCSFTSNSIDRYIKILDSYLDVAEKEIIAGKALIKEKGFNIESIYMGGGTPTSLPEKYFERYMNMIRDNFSEGLNLKEFSLEAGRPDSITEEKLRIAKEAGVTRISVNPQTMNDKTLELIGRRHTAESTVKAFYLAREAGFTNINMDIIAGLPGEDINDFEKTLSVIRELEPDSITVHTLSVKRAADLKKSESMRLLENATVGEMVTNAKKMCHSMGLMPYYMYRQKNMLGNHENVCYLRKGCESPYNVHIMEEDQTIVAFGAGSVTKAVDEKGIRRSYNVKGIEEYMTRIDEMIEKKSALF